MKVNVLMHEATGGDDMTIHAQKKEGGFWAFFSILGLF